MSNQVYLLDSYRFSEGDLLFFDANVWLYIYGPQGKLSSRLKAAYTSFFRQVRRAKVPIYIDILVLSEFINSYARFFYNNLPLNSKPSEFKEFRKSADFQLIADEIYNYGFRIVEKCELTHLVLQSAGLRFILRQFPAGESDFNDQMIAELCRVQGLKLNTHDADFKGEDLTIITANGRLLT